MDNDEKPVGSNGTDNDPQAEQDAPPATRDLINRGFKKIVEEPEDIEQLIAYARYKVMKNEWVLATNPDKITADEYYKTEPCLSA